MTTPTHDDLAEHWTPQLGLQIMQQRDDLALQLHNVTVKRDRVLRELADQISMLASEIAETDALRAQLLESQRIADAERNARLQAQDTISRQAQEIDDLRMRLDRALGLDAMPV